MAMAAVEFDADLKQTPRMSLLLRDSENDFVTKGLGKRHEWTCNCCGANFTGHKLKLTLHIAGKKFSSDKHMDVRYASDARNRKGLPKDRVNQLFFVFNKQITFQVALLSQMNTFSKLRIY